MSDPVHTQPSRCNVDAALADLLAMARADDRLRGVLVRLGRALVELEPPAAVVPPLAPVPPPMIAAPMLRPAPAPDLSPRLVQANGGAGAAVATYAARAEPSLPDLAPVVERMTIRADACEAHAHRHDRPGEGGEGGDGTVEAQIQDRMSAAGGGKLWMFRPDVTDADPAFMRTLAECYRNAGRAARLAATAQAHPDGPVPLERALPLLAEAVSALRVGIRQVFDGADAEQEQAFLWLRGQTERSHIFVDRFMRLDDPADPQQWADLRARLERGQSSLDAERKRASSLRQIQYHAKKLTDAVPGSDEATSQAKQLVDKVARQVTGGLPPSNVPLRETLLPVLDRLPADAGDHPVFGQVLRAIHEYVTARDEVEEASAVDGEPTADVVAVREALTGKAIVVVGGQARGKSAETLRHALGLSRVDWITSRPHESHYKFEPAIRRSDVAVVLLLIRFSSHSFSEIEAFCDNDGKPLVRMPRGYGVNQVAAEIRAQAGVRLGIVPG